MESFFALLQKSNLYRRRWTTRDALRIAIISWIGRTMTKKVEHRDPVATTRA
jgi:putative transposase